MACDAATSAVVVKAARPAPSRVAVPKVAEPSLKVTVPVGTPLAGGVGVTVAVNVTVWLYTEGLADEVTAVDVVGLVTTWAAEFPLLPAQPAPPVNVAVITWLPAASAVVLN